MDGELPNHRSKNRQNICSPVHSSTHRQNTYTLIRIYTVHTLTTKMHTNLYFSLIHFAVLSVCQNNSNRFTDRQNCKMDQRKIKAYCNIFGCVNNLGTLDRNAAMFRVPLKKNRSQWINAIEQIQPFQHEKGHFNICIRHFVEGDIEKKVGSLH